MKILDTDHVTLLLRRGTDGRRLAQLLERLPAKQVATTVITYEEQTRGWFGYMAKARTLAGQVEAYAKLKQHLDNYRALQILDFDERSAVEFQRLRNLKLHVGTSDLKIAAITLVNDATLLTRNRIDFGRIPGLRFEDWTT